MKATTSSVVFTALAFLAIARFDVRTADADTFGGGANQFNIEFVTIGNPGNPADTTGNPSPAGSVAKAYRMGKFEISRDMVIKANSAGRLSISLYDMTPFGGNGVNRPATVSWNEAARFVNWLNISTGSTPAYKFALQPGEAGYNANQEILMWDVSDPGYNANNRYRNSRARYFLPSLDEWYKAAYFDPTNGVYYDYPTGSNIAPTPVVSGTAAGTAVYLQANATGPADITLAGGLSPYKTMGQGGNVYEWLETDYDRVNGPTPRLSPRELRGGYWENGYLDLLSSGYRADLIPTEEPSSTGFRVANIPEPAGIVLGLIGVAASCCGEEESESGRSFGSC